jgi:hypothetical protein
MRATRYGLFSLAMVLAFACFTALGAPPAPAHSPKGPDESSSSASSRPSAEDSTAADSLSSPEALAKAAAKDAPVRPEKTKEWETLTSLQKDEARKEYEQKMTDWRKKNDLHGKKVQWRLILDDVAKPKSGDGHLVNAHSSSGFQISGLVKETDEKFLLSLKKGQIICLSGVIEDYSTLYGTQTDNWFDTSPDRSNFKFTLSNVTVTSIKEKPDDGWAGARHVVFCVHAAGQMAFATRRGGRKFDVLRTLMLDMIGHLSPVQDFQIVMFQEGPVIEMPPKHLQPVTPETRTAAAHWLNEVVPHGAGSNPVPSLNRSFDILKAAKGEGKVIIFLTGGSFPSNDALDRCIKQRNGYKAVHISIYSFGDDLEEGTIKLLKKISEDSGGKYENLND